MYGKGSITSRSDHILLTKHKRVHVVAKPYSQKPRKRSQSAYNILTIDHNVVNAPKPRHLRRKRSKSTFSPRSIKEKGKRKRQHQDFLHLTHFFKQNRKLLLTSPADCEQTDHILLRQYSDCRKKSKYKKTHYNHRKRQERLRSSSFSEKVTLYNRDREFFLLNKLQNEPVNIKQKMDETSVKFRIIKDEGTMNLRALTDWIIEYNTDKHSFRSLERFAVIKLNELNASNRENLKGMKNRLKTAVCCDLIQDFMDLHMSTVNDEFKHEVVTKLLKAIYSDIDQQQTGNKYDIHQLIRCMPYFMVSRKMVKQLQKTQMKDDEADLNFKLLRGAISMKQKFKMFTGMKKQQDISIKRIFIVWKEHSKLTQNQTKKAEKILRKYALLMRKNTKLSMFANWKKAMVIIKEKRQQREYDRLLYELHRQKRELAALMDAKDKLEKKRRNLQKLVNEQELEKKLGLFISPEKIKAQQDFERQLEILRGIKTEFMELPGTINYIGSLMDNNNQDLTKLFDEEIVLRWLEYQLKIILKTVQNDYDRMKQKIEQRYRSRLSDVDSASYDETYASAAAIAKSLAAVKKLLSPKSELTRSTSFAMSINESESFLMAIESDDNAPQLNDSNDIDMEYLSPVNKNDKNIDVGDFRKLKTIIQDVIDCGLDDFGEDFEGGKIWLILFYFLFDAANFESLKELLQLLKYSHVKHQRYHLVVDKIISLYRQYLDVNNKFGYFINAGTLESNLNVMNFSLLLQFILAKPNIMMKSENINNDELQIKGAIHLVSTVMGRLTYDENASLFKKEGKSIQNKINKFRDRKQQLINQHRKWSEMEKRFDMRLLKELCDFKAGKLNFLYEPTYPHYVIKNIINIPFYTVQSIYSRYFKSNENKMRNDYQLTLKHIEKGMGVIYALLKKYTTQNGAELSFIKYDKMLLNCKLFVKKDAYALRHLFKEIWKATKNTNETQQFHLKCYENLIKSKQSKFRPKNVELMTLDAQKFGLLLVYIAEMLYFDCPNMTPSVKVNVLLQQHLLKMVYPKSDIIAFSHLNMIRLLQKRKTQQLDMIWYHCKEIDKKRSLNELAADLSNNSVQQRNGLIDTITIEAIAELLSKHTENVQYGILHELCETMASYQENSRMDHEGLFSIICYIGDQMIESQQKMHIHEKIASFIDKLSGL